MSIQWTEQQAATLDMIIRKTTDDHYCLIGGYEFRRVIFQSSAYSGSVLNAHGPVVIVGVCACQDCRINDQTRCGQAPRYVAVTRAGMLLVCAGRSSLSGLPEYVPVRCGCC